MNYNCSNLLDTRNIQEQVKKVFCYQNLFWPFTVWINCSSDLKHFANSQPSSSNFKSFSWSLEQFFLTVGQINFVYKIPFTYVKTHLCRIVRIIIGVKGLWNKVENCWTTEEFSFNHVISSLYVQIRGVSTILCFSLIILFGVAGYYMYIELKRKSTFQILPFLRFKVKYPTGQKDNWTSSKSCHGTGQPVKFRDKTQDGTITLLLSKGWGTGLFLF